MTEVLKATLTPATSPAQSFENQKVIFALSTPTNTHRMGSLLSGWEGNTLPAPLSVEEELKLQRPSIGRRSSVGSRPGSISDVLFPIGSEPMEERPSLLSKVADMQTGDGTGHKVTFKTGDPIRVHVRGTRGSTVVIDTQPTTPNHEEGEEEEDSITQKWWKKLPSSVLNDERESFEVSTEPSSYMPQFDLTGQNPYLKAMTKPKEDIAV